MFCFKNYIYPELNNILRIKHAPGFLILPARQNSTTNSEPSFATAKWDLLSAVCLERKPVITPQLTPLEIEMADIMARLEFVQSLKSDHEIRQEEEM
jgi:large subunit ribosomal protein L46